MNEHGGKSLKNFMLKKRKEIKEEKRNGKHKERKKERKRIIKIAL